MNGKLRMNAVVTIVSIVTLTAHAEAIPQLSLKELLDDTGRYNGREVILRRVLISWGEEATVIVVPESSNLNDRLINVTTTPSFEASTRKLDKDFVKTLRSRDRVVTVQGVFRAAAVRQFGHMNLSRYQFDINKVLSVDN